MSGADDLAAAARAFGLRIERDSLEQWAPLLRAQFEDLDRLIDLPIGECEPAFIGLHLRYPPSREAP